VSESKNWSPGKWSEKAIRLLMRRVYRQALADLDYLVGTYAANLIYAEMMASMKSEQSRAELQRRGVATIGKR
jgi:hypothetical protein